MSICDKMVVLDQGHKLAEGTPREIQNNRAVMAAYLGEG
jgi:branched-chain amino acid transport system ATP-binding protein